MALAWLGPVQGEESGVNVRSHVNADPSSREIPLDVDARNFVPRHIGLDLMVLFKEFEEVVEMLNAHILNAEVINNQTK